MYIQTEEDNFCNYYVLPLLKIGKASFGGEDNFINSYLNKANQVIVEVKSLKGFRFDFQKSEYISKGVSKGNFHYLVFNIPRRFHATLDKFRQGKYSEFNYESKQLIRDFSGLNYKIKQRGVTHTHYILLILDKSKDFKAVLEREYEIIIPEGSELASKPHKNNFREEY